MERGPAREAAASAQQAETAGATSASPAHPESPRARKTAESKGPDAPGLEFPRYFTLPSVDPFDEVEWEIRSGRDRERKGQGRLRAARRRDSQALVPAGHQHRRLQVPSAGRRIARARAQRETADRPRGRYRSRTGRVSRRYLGSEDALLSFSAELKHLLVYQKAAFNSPVWFNCGFEKAPQCSACFINAVQDTMDSILTLARTEGMLFKFGSGTAATSPPSARRKSTWPAAAPPAVPCRS